MFDVKHCGKFKGRLLADGHLTKEPNETVYSGVVSLRNLRLTMFLAELNGLQLWGVHIGNAYLQALTKERLCIVAGPEFEELQGHVLVMHKALYIQDLGEHVGMANLLIFSTKWNSNLPKQSQTYG